MPSTEKKLGSSRAWLSFAAFMPLLGCMIEAVALWVFDMRQEDWFVESALSGPELMTALIASLMEAVLCLLFFFTVRHIERGWRAPAVICGAVLAAAQTLCVFLWHLYSPLTPAWYTVVLIALRLGAAVLPLLYAVRMSERRTRTLSRIALALFLAEAFLQEGVFLTLAFRALAGMAFTRRLIHGFSYVLMNFLLGAGCYTGLLPSDRPTLR